MHVHTRTRTRACTCTHAPAPVHARAHTHPHPPTPTVTLVIVIMEETLPSTFKTAVQNGYQKERPPDESAYVNLHTEIVNELGGPIGVQGLNWRVLLLGHALARAKRQVGEARTVEYRSRDETCEVGEEEFVYTMVSAAEDFFARMKGVDDRSEMYHDDGSRRDEFDRWYQRFRYHFRKLREMGYLERRRPCVEGAKGLLGSVWACPCLTADQIQSMPQCQELPIRPSDLEDEEVEEFCTSAGYVDVACTFQILLARRHPERFRYAEVCSSVRDRGTYSDAVRWAQAFARDGSRPHPGDSGDRHMSIGAFREPVRERGVHDDTPCTVPWIVLEPEAGDLVDRFEATRRVLQALDVEGADLSKVVVSYSGNKSFHVRIPTGMVGAPVFESAETARTVIQRFAREVVDEELDANLFDPRHLIRCIGSVHEKTGRHVAGVHADTFLELSLEEMLSASEQHYAFALGDPYRTRRTELAGRMREACRTLTDFWIPEYEECPTMESSGGSVAHRAMQGVEEGDQWHEKHQGRNKATFIAACYLIEKHGEKRAWPKVQEVNQRHSPSLPRTEVKTCFESAKRTVS